MRPTGVGKENGGPGVEARRFLDLVSRAFTARESLVQL